MTLAETIRETTRRHLLHNRGLLFAQVVTAVGWIGGTVPELTEKEGIVELSMADVAGPGIAVGAALMGRRPIFVIRYQGFMWYNAVHLVTYAAQSKELWGVPCPIFIRSIANEGSFGSNHTGCHHGIVMRSPGMPVCAPMTPNEWLEAWKWFMNHDDPIYVSEHRKAYPSKEDMPNITHNDSQVTLLAISAGRLNALSAMRELESRGVTCDLFHVLWLKPFQITEQILDSLHRTGCGIVIDSDFEVSGPSRSIAYELMHASGVPVRALGLEDRTAGTAPLLDNVTPSPGRIVEEALACIRKKSLDERPRKPSRNVLSPPSEN